MKKFKDMNKRNPTKRKLKFMKNPIKDLTLRGNNSSQWKEKKIRITKKDHTENNWTKKIILILKLIMKEEEEVHVEEVTMKDVIIKKANTDLPDRKDIKEGVLQDLINPENQESKKIGSKKNSMKKNFTRNLLPIEIARKKVALLEIKSLMMITIEIS